MVNEKDLVAPMALPDDLDIEALEERIADLYHTLADVADDLSTRTVPGENEPTREFLDNLPWRMSLDEVRCYLLAARHELHGAITALVKFHGRTPTRRPADGEPQDYTPPCAAGSLGE